MSFEMLQCKTVPLVTGSNPIQAKRYNGIRVAPPGVAPVQRSRRMAEGALEPRQPNQTGLPDKLKAGVESLSGLDLSAVRVHYNSDQPAQLQALAYTQGTDIHVAPGQERHLPHETWHVVQQAQGRVQPTMQLQGQGGVGVNDDAGLEWEAGEMGERALTTETKKTNQDKKPVPFSLAEEKYGIQGFGIVENRKGFTKQRVSFLDKSISVMQLAFNIDRVKAYGSKQKERYQGPSRYHIGTVVDESFQGSKDEVEPKKGEDFDTHFLNHYSPEQAVMDENYRRQNHKFYASDVFFHQYSSVIAGADLGGGITVDNIPATPPRIIKRSRVQNDATVAILNLFFEATGPMTQSFDGVALAALLKTPNGASTQSIISDYNELNRLRGNGPTDIHIDRAMVTRADSSGSFSWSISFILLWS